MTTIPTRIRYHEIGEWIEQEHPRADNGEFTHAENWNRVIADPKSASHDELRHAMKFAGHLHGHHGQSLRRGDISKDQHEKMLESIDANVAKIQEQIRGRQQANSSVANVQGDLQRSLPGESGVSESDMGRTDGPDRGPEENGGLRQESSGIPDGANGDVGASGELPPAGQDTGTASGDGVGSDTENGGSFTATDNPSPGHPQSVTERHSATGQFIAKAPKRLRGLFESLHRLRDTRRNGSVKTGELGHDFAKQIYDHFQTMKNGVGDKFGEVHDLSEDLGHGAIGYASRAGNLVMIPPKFKGQDWDVRYTLPHESQIAATQPQPKVARQPKPKPEKPEKVPAEPKVRSLNPNTKLGAAITDAIGTDPQDQQAFKTLVTQIWEEEHKQALHRNAGLLNLLSQFGFNGRERTPFINAARRVASKGGDSETFSKLYPQYGKKFDQIAEMAEKYHPELLTFTGAGEQAAQDAGNALLMRFAEGGVESLPRPYDDKIIAKALEYTQAGWNSASEHDKRMENDPAYRAQTEAIMAQEFSRRGVKIRYRRWLGDRLSRWRRYGKQLGFTWGDEQERKHPRDDEGKFKEKGSGEEPKQPRAKSGGEYGPNGEWYKGGAWIATTDLPKRVREKMEKAAAVGDFYEPGKKQVPEPGKLAILTALGTANFNWRDGTLSDVTMGYYGYDADKVEQAKELADRYYNHGERWVDLDDYPRFSRYSDVARVALSGKAISGEALKMIAAYRGETTAELKEHLGLKEYTSKSDSQERLPEAKSGPAGKTRAEVVAEIVGDNKRENLNYDQACRATWLYLGSNPQKWTTVPIKGLAKTTGPTGQEVEMPEFEFPKGYKPADTFFSQPQGGTGGGCCELCGHDIKNAYHIQNDDDKLTMIVGSECVTLFTEGKSGQRLAKEAQWAANRDLLRQTWDARESLAQKFGHFDQQKEQWEMVGESGVYWRLIKDKGYKNADKISKDDELSCHLLATKVHKTWKALQDLVFNSHGAPVHHDKYEHKQRVWHQPPMGHGHGGERVRSSKYEPATNAVISGWVKRNREEVAKLLDTVDELTGRNVAEQQVTNDSVIRYFKQRFGASWWKYAKQMAFVFNEDEHPRAKEAVTIGSTNYTPGEWVPKDKAEDASPAEQEKIEVVDKDTGEATPLDELKQESQSDVSSEEQDKYDSYAALAKSAGLDVRSRDEWLEHYRNHPSRKPKEPAVENPPAKSEPWKMTRGAWHALQRGKPDYDIASANREHKQSVADAIDAGADVTPDAYADYPDLKEMAENKVREPIIPDQPEVKLAVVNAQQSLFDAGVVDKPPAPEAKAVATTEAAMGKAIDDFGERIGGARKHTAAKLGPRQKSESEEPVAAWRRRYQVMQLANTGKFSVFDTKKEGRFGGMANCSREPFDTKEAAEAAIPLIAVARNHRVSNVAVHGAPSNFAICRQVTDRKRPIIKDGFATYEDAMKYMALHPEEIIQKNVRFDDSIHPSIENVERAGRQHRENDRPATPEDFQAFGFYGVQFGKWNNMAERQRILNHAYDSLMDLADVLNLPPAALSLNGQLGLAFGARGTGGKGAAGAHFEPGYNVINLTKIFGAGALAHEWMHALDHYMARKTGMSPSEKVKNENGDMVYPFDERYHQLPSGNFNYKAKDVDPELKSAWDHLRDVMHYRTMKFTEDESLHERRMQRQSDELQEHLTKIRADFARDHTGETYSRYRGKRALPASPEVMKEVDDLCAKILAGDVGEIVNVGDRPRSGMFWTPFQIPKNIARLSELHKELRGNRGFFKDASGRMSGPIANIKAYASRKKDADALLADAQAMKVKEKKVRTDYLSQAERLDGGSAKDYWQTADEMQCRAFEAYVYDKLKGAKGGRNDFLAYEKHNDLPEYRMFNIKPFPEKEERQTIDEAFDSFVKALKPDLLGVDQPRPEPVFGPAVARKSAADKPVEPPKETPLAEPELTEKDANDWVKHVSKKIAKLRSDNATLLQGKIVTDGLRRAVSQGRYPQAAYDEKVAGGHVLNDEDYAKALEVVNQIDAARQTKIGKLPTTTTEEPPTPSEPADNAIVNVPLSQRGDIDAQIDAHKKKQADDDKAKRSASWHQDKEDKEIARKLFEQHGEAVAASTVAKHGGDHATAMKTLDSMVKWEPGKARKMLEKFAADKPEPQAVPAADSGPIAVLAPTKQEAKDAVNDIAAYGHDETAGAGESVQEKPSAVDTSQVSESFDPETHGGYKPLIELAERIHSGELPADQYKQQYAFWRKHAAEHIADLQKRFDAKQLKNIAGNLGSYQAKTSSKAENAKSVYDSLLINAFHVGGSMFSYGMEGRQAALDKHVAAQTDETMAAAKKKSADEDEKKQEAVSDPKTIADFHQAMRHHGGYEKLPEEQKVAYDTLQATQRREHDKSRKATVRAFQGTTGAVGIVEGHHQKRNAPTFTVTVEEHLGDDWQGALSRARQLGGSYVNKMIARRYGATPGFQFFSREAADKFAETLKGKDVDRSDILDERRVGQIENSGDRLAAMAELTRQRAQEKLDAPRQTNTARRADMAAGAEANARSEIAKAHTLGRIAEGLKADSLQHLAGIRARTHLDALDTALTRSRYDRLRGASHEEWEKRNETPMGPEDVNGVKYPYPSLWASELNSHLDQFEEVPGLKNLARSLRKTADVSPYSKKVAGFTTNGGKALMATDLEEQLPQAKHLIGEKAVRVHASQDPALLRGKHEIAYTADKGKSWGISPEIAVAAALNKNHENLDLIEPPRDQRLEITDEHTIGELSKAVSKLKRKGDPRLRRIAESMQGSLDDYNRLQAMDIKSPSELRAALREYLPLKAKQDSEDPVKKKERALAGQKIPGFFPTPRPLIDGMLAAADIQPGHSILEPSAGKGDILDAIKESYPKAQAIGIEPHSSLREIMQAKGHEVSDDADFLEHSGKYQRIIANPPFANRQDVSHIRHAYDHLNPGGRLVFIMSAGPFHGSSNADREFQQWIEDVGADVTDNPEGSFSGSDSFRQTGVNTKMVVIDRPS